MFSFGWFDVLDFVVDSDVFDVLDIWNILDFGLV